MRKQFKKQRPIVKPDMKFNKYQATQRLNTFCRLRDDTIHTIDYSEMLELCDTFSTTQDFYSDQQSITAVMKALRKIYSIQVNRIRSKIFSCMKSIEANTNNKDSKAYKQVEWAAKDKKFVQLYHLLHIQDKPTADHIRSEIEAADKLFHQCRIIKETTERERERHGSWTCSGAYLKVLSVRSNLDGTLYKEVKEYYEQLKKQEELGIEIATPMFDAMRTHHAYCLASGNNPKIVETQLIEMTKSLMGKFDEIGLSIAINALSEIGSEESLDLAAKIFLNGHDECNRKIYSLIWDAIKPDGDLEVNFHIKSTDQQIRGIPTNLATRITELIMSNLQPARTVTLIHGFNGGTKLQEALKKIVDQMNNIRPVKCHIPTSGSGINECGFFVPKYSIVNGDNLGRSIIGRNIYSNTMRYRGICP